MIASVTVIGPSLFCQSVRPVQGPKNTKLGKEGFEKKKKKTFPPTPDKGVSSQNLPIVPVVPK